MKRVVPAAVFAISVRAVMILLGAMVGPCASAEDAAAAPSEQAQKTTAENKPICTYQPVTGSNIRKKRCTTQAVLDEERRASQAWMSDLNRNAVSSGARPQ